MTFSKEFEDYKVVKQVFDRYEVPLILGYGGLLGLYRDGKLLPGDDDLDLCVVQPVSLQKKKSIGWMLYDLGFKPQEIMFNVFGKMEAAEIGYNGDAETGIIICEKNIKFTLFFFKKDSCDLHTWEYVCVPKLGAMKLIASPSKFYHKLGEIDWNGEKVLTPSPIEDYLEFSYEDWKDPLKRDHSPTFFESHPEQVEQIKDVTKHNQVVQYAKTPRST